MTRMYIQPSFVDSCSEHGLWSGGNDQYRGDKSKDISTFDKNGRARIEAFSDEAIEKLKPKTKVPLKTRILPQLARLEKLTAECYELEAAFKAGEYTLDEYSLLRSVAFKRRDRAQELYQKAITIPKCEHEELYEDINKVDEYDTDSTQEVEDNTQNGQDVERENSIVKLAVKLPKDLIYFASASLIMLVCLKLIL